MSSHGSGGALDERGGGSTAGAAAAAAATATAVVGRGCGTATGAGATAAGAACVGGFGRRGASGETHVPAAGCLRAVRSALPLSECSRRG